MKIKFSRELQIGTLVIVTIAILYFGINYLKGINIFNPTNYYYVKLEQVNGLVASNPVTIKGYKIGLVKSINYNYDSHEDDIVIVLQVDDQLKIPVGSKAVLKTELLGGASMSLDLQSVIPGVYYKKGDTIPAVIDGGIMTTVTTEIMPRVQSIVPQLDSLITSLRMITDDNSIEQSLGNIKRLTANLESSSVSLNSMMKKDLPVILSNVNTITTDFSKLSKDLSQVDFNATMLSLNHTLSNLQLISDRINNGEGSIGLLINDKSFYNNLNSTMESANNLLLDLKSNPKRYVHFSLFGKSDKK
ncbi:MAG: MlaD family protein [Prevotellaceae bacterium]|jgi:phospholipid/cholesterol/gamma-HCH transport system substrate-binding protein|nr:MlaD family protein [Prevotellaceae bacterium]